MASESTSTSHRYQEILASLTSKLPDERLKKALSEVLALLDFNSTLNQTLALDEILDLVLFVSMGETRASWAGILLRDDEERLVPRARRGRRDDGWTRLKLALPREPPPLATAKGEASSEWLRKTFAETKASLLAPLVKSDRLVGVLLLGDRQAPYGPDERTFAEALCVSAAASIDNGRIYEELRELNQRLSFKVYQLNSLFDITRELNRSPTATRVHEVLLTNAMGHVLATRALVLHDGSLVEQRGVRLQPDDRAALEAKADLLASLPDGCRVASLEDEGLRELLSGLGMQSVIPLRSGESAHGALLLGPRASGKSFTEEDRDFLRSLASQAAAALDNLRLTREWIEKQKIEKEMAIAREIQRALLPDGDPSIDGWDVAGINIPCLTVGGDYFDYLPRKERKEWLVIADVSGKGTGAALLMASIQAALHALAGLGDISLEALTERLNDIVYDSTAGNRYVTAFFGSLDVGSGVLEFVNAGHCYPILMRRDGTVERLVEGASVVGLMRSMDIAAGSTRLEKGDMLVAYTDGLSETANPEGEEFGDERICEMMRQSRGRASREIVARLVAGVRVFAAESGLADDLTLMVVQRV
jgi:serine phosphatase RsbU (regulator of sigma subunit)